MVNSWQSEDIRVNGHSLHYLRTGGKGKTSLVLVHGFSDSGALWTPVAREFEMEYDIVMPDMLGHGLSDRYIPGSTPDMASDVAELVKALGLRRPIICGHSMGAMVSYQAVIRFPHLFQAVFLEDPPWFSSLPQDAKTLEQWRKSDGTSDNPVARWAKTLKDKTLDGLLLECRQENPSWSDELVRLMCEAKKNLDQEIIDPLAEILETQGGNWESGLAGIEVPFGLIAGNPAQGGIVTPGVIDAIHAQLDGAFITAVSSAGHLIRFNAPTEYLAALRAFFRQVRNLI